MRAFWDERARTNAAWYVDTSLSFEHPDMKRFFAAGREIVEYGLTQLPVELPGRSLAVEIGSGLGRICLELAGIFASVVGVDISPEMVKRAMQLVPDERVTVVVGDGSTLSPIADASADLVFSFTVFQHMTSVPLIERYIQEAARVLRPGGIFVFQWNNTPAVKWMLGRQIPARLSFLTTWRRPSSATRRLEPPS